DAVLLGETEHQVARHPHLVSGGLGALAEDLALPLALGHLGVDAFVIDPGGEAEVEMLFDDLARDVADVLVADAGIVRTLRRWVARRREAERAAVLVEEIFLLEAEPGVGIIDDGGALVRGMRRLAVRHHYLAHDEDAVGPRPVRIDRDRLEHAIRRMTLGLHRRASV